MRLCNSVFSTSFAGKCVNVAHVIAILCRNTMNLRCLRAAALGEGCPNDAIRRHVKAIRRRVTCAYTFNPKCRCGFSACRELSYIICISKLAISCMEKKPTSIYYLFCAQSTSGQTDVCRHVCFYPFRYLCATHQQLA